MKTCAWCKGPISATMRRDAECCSVRCRQARHRFTTGVGVARSIPEGESIRLAYADPPYPGLSKTYYQDHRDYAGEVDHAELIRRLSTYDGWALSTNARSLQFVLGLCPPGVRIASWVRGERPADSGEVLNSWEPVIFHGGRSVDLAGATRRGDRHDASSLAARDAYSLASEIPNRRIDSLVHHSRPRLTDPERVIGAKPAVFCRWIFELLGAQPQDDFTDMFPGSGGVQRAWDIYSGHDSAPAVGSAGALG